MESAVSSNSSSGIDGGIFFMGFMNTRLSYIQNWSELAKEANWSVSELAKRCDVSTRTLDHYFKANMGQTPKKWLAESRQHQAINLLNRGHSVKEAAGALGYKYAPNFSRKFKKYWGFCPKDSLIRPRK
jgi:transcriptional regulator GlxA family with amidase domain